MVNKVKYYVLVAILALGSLFVLTKCHRRQDAIASAPVLRPGIVEKIIVNPTTHKLTIVMPRRTDTLFLPDRPSSIEVEKSGKIDITSHQIGVELKPFIGAGIGEKPGMYLGLDLVYFKRFDGGLFGSINTAKALDLGLSIGYNIWDNISVNVGTPRNGHPNLFISVRF